MVLSGTGCYNVLICRLSVMVEGPERTLDTRNLSVMPYLRENGITDHGTAGYGAVVSCMMKREDDDDHESRF